MPSPESAIRRHIGCFTSPNMRIRSELRELAKDFGEAMERRDSFSAQALIDQARELRESPFPLILIRGGKA